MNIFLKNIFSKINKFLFQKNISKNFSTRKIFFLIAGTVFYFLFFSSAIFFQNCAQIVQPTGGKRDTIPPRIVKEKSTTNFQTNFIKQRITLTFDEWIKLEDPFNQVVISPPLNERPDVKLDSKKVIFDFSKDEVLRANATYTINFGNAVRDLSENNPAKDLRFVFSTGSVIDSFSLRAKITDAATGAPVESAVFMLYDNLSDTVVRKLKPFYFGRSNAQGVATIENVRAGTFKAVALADKDQNYLFNPETENIGFLDSNLIVTDKFLKSDTLAHTYNITVFESVKKQRLITKETDKYGVVKILYANEPKNITLTIDSAFGKTVTEIVKDTLLVWYDAGKDFSGNLIARHDTVSDTVRVRSKGRVDFMKKNKFAFNIGGDVLPKHLVKPIGINYNFPISKIDTAFITFTDTSKEKKKINYHIDKDTAAERKIIFDAPLTEGIYFLKFYPKALTNIYGMVNDTMAFKIIVPSEKDYGVILLSVTNLDSTRQYVLQLITGGGTLEKEFVVKNTSKFNKRIETLLPDDYTLKIIEDTNRNERWDTGDYDTHRQPERIFRKKIQGLRANWELEEAINLETLKE